jgi:hypothetical protein
MEKFWVTVGGKLLVVPLAAEATAFAPNASGTGGSDSLSESASAACQHKHDEPQSNTIHTRCKREAQTLPAAE